MHKNDLIIKRNVTIYKIKMGEFIYICFICWLFFQKRIFWCTVNNQDVDTVYGKIVGKFSLVGYLYNLFIICFTLKNHFLMEYPMLVEKIFLNNKVEFMIILFENILYFFFIEKIFKNNILYIKKKNQSLKKIRTKLF